VQWDGYVVDPTAWREEFRHFDYIGAPIRTKEGAVVGNGGFCWRSRKLLQAAAQLPIVKHIPADILLSVTFRDTLEKDSGLRFAPLDIARRFSYELGPFSGPTFGFHGQFNLWRYEPDEEVIRIFNSKPKGTVFSRDSFALVVTCLRYGRRSLAEQLYALFRREHDLDFMWRHLRRKDVPFKAFRYAIDQLEPDPARDSKSAGGSDTPDPTGHAL
jgi:hypothetical protein